MSDGTWVQGSVYFYAPNRGAAIFFAIAFGAACVTHFYQSYHYKNFKVTGLFSFCCLLFTAGFCLRVYGSFRYDDLWMFVASQCLIYASPPLLELGNFHILGRILYYVPYFAPLHPGRTLTTFGIISGIVEALNGWGISYSVNQALPESQRQIGHALMKASLLLQIVVAVVFLSLTASVHLRCRRAGITNRKVLAPLHTLYFSMAIICARTIFRTVEYFSISDFDFHKPGFDPMRLSPIIRYEWFFYVFEASLMLLNVALISARHPRRWLPQKSNIYLAQDGVTEIEGPGWQDKRPWLVTLMDPFDVGGMCRGDRENKKFWENNGYDTPSASNGVRKEQESA